MSETIQPRPGGSAPEPRGQRQHKPSACLGPPPPRKPKIVDNQPHLRVPPAPNAPAPWCR